MSGARDAGGLFGGLIGGLFSAAGAVYDSIQNRKSAKENTDKTLAAQKAEAELAYQRSIEQWNLQNAYNTPSAQMARFAAGGLNPNLIYGQGSSGNANDKPEYRPADQQYNYAPLQVGEGFAGILPVLMSVGTWMQNMRLGEVDIQKKASETDRTQQLIDYLSRANPKLLAGMENKLSLFPFQKSMLDYQSNISRTKLFELEQEFRNQYGDSLFGRMGSAWEDPYGRPDAEIGGVKRLKFLQEVSKQKLEEARASWTEFDITNPQQLIMMVLQGVMGMAGSSLKLSAQKGLRQKTRTVSEVENKMKTGRSTIRRRILEKN